MSTPQQHRLIGQVIAERYQVVELIAEGGMGAVYLAEHLTLHKQVALKIVHPEHAGNSDLASRFAREAMATSRIDHPNVISAMDFGTLSDGTAYLAVQLVRGPSLMRVLAAERQLPFARAAQFGMQIADALSAAHGHGIIHRDLKPDNVLLQQREDGSEVVKVLDFGVAKFAPESKVPLHARTDVTQVGMVVGTPGYMAPEQTIGNPADERSDLYALGVILWEAIVGRALWSAPDLQALVEKQMSETPPLVRAAGGDPSIPDALEQLIAQLLSRRAEERPSDAALVRDELRKYAAGYGEPQRWRTGERPLRSYLPNSSEVTIPLDPSELRKLSSPPPSSNGSARAIDEDKTEELDPSRLSPVAPALISESPRHRLTTSLPARLRSSRAAWVVAGLLATILLAGVVLVLTGRLELRPRGEVAAVAEKLKLAPAPVAEPEKDKPPRRERPARDEAPRKAVDPSESAPERTPAVPGDVAPRGERPRAQPERPAGVYLRHQQSLSRARTCQQKRTEIDALAALGDARALPFLKRMDERPHTGCGKKKREDCLGCVRASLTLAIERLEAK